MLAGMHSVYLLLLCISTFTQTGNSFTVRIDSLVQTNYVLNLLEVEFRMDTNGVQPTSGVLSSTSVIEPSPNGPVSECFDGDLNTYCSSGYPAVSSPWMTLSVSRPFDTILGI